MNKSVKANHGAEQSAPDRNTQSPDRGQIVYDLETKTWGLFINAMLVDGYDEFCRLKEQMASMVQEQEELCREAARP